jgi:surface antigen
MEVVSDIVFSKIALGEPASRRAGYRSTGNLRLWLHLLAAGSLGLSCAGCSMSYQLDNIFAKADKAEAETTGSIPQPKTELPPEADLVLARKAASELLMRGGKDVSVPWENSRSGARGTVTSLGADYRSDGQICRDFLASYVSATKESWMQGEACRKAGDTASAKWEIRSLKPWRRT